MKLCTILCLFLCGCSSLVMVARPEGPGSQNAPIGAAARDGVIKYLAMGSESRIQDRRADAYKEMSEACNSRYKIKNEAIEVNTGPGEPGRQYNVITFSCAP